ncbi:acyl-CoA dehydrogenase family protein [Parvibaculum sp.]|uniref:acyl-CoA dehydrogenase family protein n=1 Tax=Parvibaculum sp. TaxID=2024848 RepID=UPI000C527C50|nr:acyl-CoA dehydrogenase family protein [Parvibaculum sp.]MAM94897.1 acyl-CoA dehydrogenase [Parvibaculum sp.]|tara:strand:+ start:7947 stop:9140 length:1194 start_codon:yes stop_codon:yes gene_type:complete
MDLTYGPEYEAFRAEVRDFISKNRDKAPKRFGVSRPSEESIAWQKLLIEHGLTARTIPKEYGGYGAEPDILKSRIIAEEFTAAKLPMGLANQGISMLVPTLLELGTEEQKKKWIEPTLKGEVIWCQGYSEPGSGSDLASLQTKATEDGDDFIINGQKIWTSTAHASDMIFCLVRTEPDAKKHEGISYLIFPMTTPGIEVRPLKTMTGHAEFNEVFFTNVRVPKKDIVAGRGQGWYVANATLKHERGMLGDPNQAGTRLKEIVDLMHEETVDGMRLIDHPIYRDRLMQLQARVLAMQFHGLRLLTAASKKEDPGIARLIVKLQGCEINHQLAALAIDVLGEIGVLYGDSPHLRAHGIWQHRYMFDLGLIIGGGTAQIQKNIISERGLGMPREPKPAKA